LSQGLIRYKKKLWVGANTATQTKIINAFHASGLGGHSGIQATYQKISKLFWWPNLKQIVESFVKQCDIYQRAKHENCKVPDLLSPLPIPDNAWQDVSMDFIDGLPKCEGYSVILVVVDRFTKYGHFFPLKHPYSAQSVAQVFFNNIVKLYGLPKTIVSDRDKVFSSSFWKELFSLLKTQLCMNSAYHAQTDGQTKRVNQCLETYLHCAVSFTPKQWLKWLPLAEIWYNSSYHTSLKCSPFKVLYDFDPSFGATPILEQTDNANVKFNLLEMGSSMDSSTQSLNFPLTAVNSIKREKPAHNKDTKV
jgi:hypothetical protein